MTDSVSGKYRIPAERTTETCLNREMLTDEFLNLLQQLFPVNWLFEVG
jgi:hypothetical protein